MACLESQVALSDMVRSTKDVDLFCMLWAEEDLAELLVFLTLYHCSLSTLNSKL